MSHVRSEELEGEHRRSACRKDRHSYGERRDIGAGIARQVCRSCGAVTIDLTGAHELTTPVISSTGKLGTRSAETSTRT